MRFNVHHIQGAAFASFTDEFSFSVSGREHGLYLIRGLNKSQPALGGNGTGKSTLWDAFFWCLTGTTTRGLGNTDIKPWGVTKPNTFVSVDFDLGGDVMTLTRRPPSELYITTASGEDHDLNGSEDVYNLIGMDKEQLLSSVIISQFGEFFFDLKPAPKQELFSKVLALESWLQASKVASAKAKDLNKRIIELEKQFAATEAALAQLSKMDVSGVVDSWEEKRQQELSDLREEIAQVEELLCTERQKELESDLDHYTGLLNDIQASLNDEDLNKRLESDFLEKCTLRMDHLDAEIDRQINDYEKAESEGCPTCGATVSDETLDKMAADLEDAIADSNQTISDLRIDIESAQQNLDSIGKVVAGLEKEYNALADKCDGLEEELRFLAHDSKQAQKELRGLNRKLSALASEKNPHQEAADEQEADAILLGHKLVNTDEQLAALKQEEQIASYWGRGFKDIRLYLIEQNLQDLELSINDALVELGLIGWKVELATESLTTRGTAKKGFQVMIHSPDNPKPVKWECWSGGEASRLRLAGQLGLIELIQASRGVSSNFEVYDEPTSWMSPEGIDDLLELLRLRAITKGKQIFLIDHHSFNFGGFSEVITVERGTNGSRIVEGI